MYIKDLKEADKAKGPFEFAYYRPSYDWFEEIKASFTYSQYNSLRLELRYGPSWWLIGIKYNEDKDAWEDVQLGEIRERDIPRLVEWAEYENEFKHKVSILTQIRCIDGELNVLGKLMNILRKDEKKPSVQPEVKIGKWIVSKDCEGKTRRCTCNLCGYETGQYTWKNPNFCEDCGAKMEGETDDEKANNKIGHKG